MPFRAENNSFYLRYVQALLGKEIYSRSYLLCPVSRQSATQLFYLFLCSPNKTQPVVLKFPRSLLISYTTSVRQSMGITFYPTEIGFCKIALSFNAFRRKALIAFLKPFLPSFFRLALALCWPRPTAIGFFDFMVSIYTNARISKVK